MRYFKIAASLLILSALLLTQQADSQALLKDIVTYGVNQWIRAQFLDYTTATRAAVNDARFYPSNAANDANFLQAQAETIHAIELDASTIAANQDSIYAPCISLAACPISDLPIIPLTPQILRSTWISTLFFLGLDVAGDLSKVYLDGQANSDSQYSVTTSNTPAGYRVKTSITGKPAYKFVNPTDPLVDVQNAVTNAINQGGQVFRSSTCLSSSACAALPYLADSSKYFLTSSLSAPYYYATTQLCLSGSTSCSGLITQLSLVGKTLNTSDYLVAFPSEATALQYLSTVGYAALPFLNFQNAYQTDQFYTACTWTDPNYSDQCAYYNTNNISYNTQVSPPKNFSVKTTINANYDTVSKEIDFSYPQRVQNGYDTNGNAVYQTNFTTGNLLNSQYKPFNTSIVPTINSLDAYGVNLGTGWQVGKISIPESMLNARMDPNQAVSILNRLWQDVSAQPGYKGLPYPSPDPLSSPALNPAIPLPVLRDLISQMEAPDGNVYISPTGTSQDPLVIQLTINNNTNNNTNNNNTNPPDLSSPALNPPTLETTPTAATILQPLLDLIKPNSTLNISAPQGVCPTGSFTAFSSTYTLDYHCTLLESIRAALSAVMLTFFAVVSFRVVMKA